MKSIHQLRNDFDRATKEFKELTNNTPRYIGDIAVKVLKENFKVSGFDTGTGIYKWKERSEKTNRAYDTTKRYKGTRYKSSNPLLYQTRNLYAGIKYKAMAKIVQVGVNLNTVPYAKAINEGLGKMPKRQVLGYSRKMDKRIKDDLLSRRNKIFSKFKK